MNSKNSEPNSNGTAAPLTAEERLAAAEAEQQADMAKLRASVAKLHRPDSSPRLRAVRPTREAIEAVRAAAARR